MGVIKSPFSHSFCPWRNLLWTPPKSKTSIMPFLCYIFYDLSALAKKENPVLCLRPFHLPTNSSLWPFMTQRSCFWLRTNSNPHTNATLSGLSLWLQGEARVLWPQIPLIFSVKSRAKREVSRRHVPKVTSESDKQSGFWKGAAFLVDSERGIYLIPIGKGGRVRSWVPDGAREVKKGRN